MALKTVRNLTALPQVLYDAQGDSVQLPPGADSKIDERFLYQRPNPAQVRILTPEVVVAPVPAPVPVQDEEEG